MCALSKHYTSQSGGAILLMIYCDSKTVWPKMKRLADMDLHRFEKRK